MIKINKTTNISGQIFTEDNEQVAYANASISAEGTVQINKSIMNQKLFGENKDSVLKDFEEFEQYVYSIIE